MANHTPGPWEVFADLDVEGNFEVREARKHMDRLDHEADQVVDNDDDAANDIYEQQNDIREANRRLIGAAPDLPAACKAALSVVPTGYGVLTALEAAIAKAEGK